MSEEERPSFSWEAVYQQQAVETMPWFNPILDADLEDALQQYGIRQGRVLDLGTGPGTQAMQLARMGFEVTASDISDTAIRRARERATDEGLNITWVVDDILATKLHSPFDLIFDRGCFHILPVERRPAYRRTVHDLLRPGGFYCLKCFSYRQPGSEGPTRFTPEQVREAFEEDFTVLSIKETIYQGTLEPRPQALFAVMGRGREARGETL